MLFGLYIRISGGFFSARYLKKIREFAFFLQKILSYKKKAVPLHPISTNGWLVTVNL